MGSLDVRFRWEGYDQLKKALEALGGKSPYALARATDEVGGKTVTVMKRAVVAQTGASYSRVSSAISTQRAMGTGQGTFNIIARDTFMSLKEFQPKRTDKGVSAAPWKKRRVFPHSFIGPGGHVFVREMVGGKRAGRLPLHKLEGPNIPKEMVKDQAEATFFAYTAVALPMAIEKWVFRLLD